MNSQFSHHSIVYVWGYNGYCRLGLGNQKDVLTPQVVPQVCRVFALRRSAHVVFAVRRATQAISGCKSGRRSDKFCGN